MLNKTLVIGHRGAPALLPENTMESFRMAFEEFHADAIEFDVRFSLDRVPIIIHDATLERTTNGKGFVAKQPFQELQKLDAGKGFRIPSLEEVLSLFKGKTLAVEIKDRSEELVHAVMALIHKHKADHCIVGSKHFLVADTLRKNYPRQRRFWSQREIVQNFIAFQGYRHSRNILSGKKGTGNIPLPVPFFPPSKEKIVASMPLEGCGMHFDDPAFLDWLHQKGITVYFWTINEPQEMKRLTAAGADGIITNHPGVTFPSP